MSKLVNFFSIMARISVPPVEPWVLKRMAEPRAGRMTPKNSSSSFSSVRGPDRGTSHSSPASMPEKRREQYTVRTPKPRLSTPKPSRRKATLMTEANREELMEGKMEERMTAMPVTPPVEK